MPLKRFLTLHGEEFSKKHPAIFKTICEALVWRLRWQLDNLASQKLLIDLVGQASLLTPVAFARGFLHVALVMGTELTLSSMVTKKPLKRG